MNPRVTKVQYPGDYRLRLWFSDGLEAEVDWSDRLARSNPGGVYAPLRDTNYFARVQLMNSNFEGIVERSLR